MALALHVTLNSLHHILSGLSVPHFLLPILQPGATIPAIRSFNVEGGTPHSNTALLIPILPSTTRSKALDIDVSLHWRSFLGLLLCSLAIFAVDLQHLFVTAVVLTRLIGSYYFNHTNIQYVTSPLLDVLQNINK